MGEAERFARFETRPIGVVARRLWVDERVEVTGMRGQRSVVQGLAGMWEIRGDGGGVCLLLPDDIFREQYKPVDAQGDALWRETTRQIYPIWPDDHPDRSSTS